MRAHRAASPDTRSMGFFCALAAANLAPHNSAPTGSSAAKSKSSLQLRLPVAAARFSRTFAGLWTSIYGRRRPRTSAAAPRKPAKFPAKMAAPPAKSNEQSMNMTSDRPLSTTTFGSPPCHPKSAHAVVEQREFIYFRCPLGHRLKADRSLAGSTGCCPICTRGVTVPARAAARIGKASLRAVTHQPAESDLSESALVRFLQSGAPSTRASVGESPRNSIKSCVRCDKPVGATARHCPHCKVLLFPTERTWQAALEAGLLWVRRRSSDGR